MYILVVFCSLTSSFYYKQTKLANNSTNKPNIDSMTSTSASTAKQQNMSDSAHHKQSTSSNSNSASYSDTNSKNQSYFSDLEVLCVLGKKYSQPIGNLKNLFHKKNCIFNLLLTRRKGAPKRYINAYMVYLPKRL
jgi:hypothetical protein